MLIRPGDPRYPFKDGTPIKREPPTWAETIEVFIGFWVMLSEVFSGCIVFLAGALGCAVSSVMLAVIIGGIAAILILFSS